MTKRTKQTVLMAAVVVLAILAGGTLYIYNWLKKSVPPTSGIIEIDGLEMPLKITYDKMGIPQIWAETERDGYFAMGYLHASDRMFQMDMARRMSQGRMSELLGDITLESDKYQRLVGHNRIARNAIVDLTEDNRSRLQAYANGVNAYMKIAGAPQFEYLLLGHGFEDWTIFDCLTLLSFQTWYSDALQNHDKFYRDIIERIDPNKAATLCFNYPDWAPVTIPESKKIGTNSNYDIPFKSTTVNPYSMSNSSNGWVVAPSRSASGSAMLASDPHLHISQLPQFWYMLGLHIKESELNVLGITTPGLPYVIMGHNGTAAWCFTAGGVQVTKNYEEKINPNDTMQYRSQNAWKTFELVTDSIFVSGEDDPEIIITKLTKHGPIIPDTEHDSTALALHWAGYDIDLNQAVQSGFNLQQTNSIQQFRQSVTTLGALNANWMYADVNGNIGYQLGTPIFDPQIDNSCLPIPGWTDISNWQEYYPAEENPHVKNPPQGWLASCNNLPTAGKDYPRISGTFAADRILRINEILRNRNAIDAAFVRRVQFDRVDAYLRRWRTEVSRLLDEIDNQELSKLIDNWDGSTGLDSKETAIMVVFLSQLNRMTFEDELGEYYRGVRTIWLDNIYNDSTLHFWFDMDSTEKIESREHISLMAINKTLSIVGNKTWGDLNTFEMQHPMASVPILGGLLNLKKEPQKWPGTGGTLNASFLVSQKDGTFKTIVGPSWRFIIDFAEIDSALFVLPSGNSGNPMSPHFFDFFELWENGQYWNVPLSREAVESKTVSTLTLTPGESQSAD